MGVDGWVGVGVGVGVDVAGCRLSLDVVAVGVDGCCG